jgi:hypothetical protein
MFGAARLQPVRPVTDVPVGQVDFGQDLDLGETGPLYQIAEPLIAVLAQPSGTSARTAPIQATCTDNNAADGTVVSATPDVDDTLKGPTREASGSLATISFTIRAD